MTSYQLTYGQQTFIAVVEKKGKDQWMIAVGGKKKGCALILISKSEGKRALEGTLNVGYNARCNVNGNLQRGNGTITMIRASLAFAWQQFKKLEKIYFKDDSHVKCNGDDLYLPPIQLAEYGKTWYERHFGAHLEEARAQSLVQVFLDRLTTETWPAFWDIISFKISKSTRARFSQQLKSKWDEHGGLKPMLLAMKKTNDCDMFIQWLGHYFRSVTNPLLLEESDYVLDRPTTQVVIEAKQLSHDPYADDFARRKKDAEERMEMFTHFVPRRQEERQDGGDVVGTRYTHGTAPLTKEEWQWI